LIEFVLNEIKESIFYYLDGDISKDFAEMNVTVKDGKGANMELLAIQSNTPTHKEFSFKFKRPMLPKQKKILKLEYDWEEAERKYSYEFSSNCKSFKYKFVIPNGIEIKNKIYRINRQIGTGIYADPPSKINHTNDKTEITWQKTNIKVHDTYEFLW
jgi:hypothetical protein